MIHRLITPERPWPAPVVDDVRAAIERILARAGSESVDESAVIGGLLRTAALDLRAIVESRSG